MAALNRETREACEARRDDARAKAESAATPGDRAQWLEVAAAWQELANCAAASPRRLVIVKSDAT